jgi:manganese oxidase
MHPHGVFYGKDSEGALYNDNTMGTVKPIEKAVSDPGQGGQRVLKRNQDRGLTLNDDTATTNTKGDFKKDDNVHIGEIYKYVWEVPETAGPNFVKTGATSKVWMYHSHYDEVRDAQTGLMGSIVIYEPGTLMSNGLPKDVD